MASLRPGQFLRLRTDSLGRLISHYYRRRASGYHLQGLRRPPDLHGHRGLFQPARLARLRRQQTISLHLLPARRLYWLIRIAMARFTTSTLTALPPDFTLRDLPGASYACAGARCLAARDAYHAAIDCHISSAAEMMTVGGHALDLRKRATAAILQYQPPPTTRAGNARCRYAHAHQEYRHSAISETFTMQAYISICRFALPAFSVIELPFRR